MKKQNGVGQYKKSSNNLVVRDNFGVWVRVMIDKDGHRTFIPTMQKRSE